MRIIHAFLIGSAIVVAAVPGYAATASAQQAIQPHSSEAQFRTWLKSLETSGAKVTTGKIEYDRGADVVKVTDLLVSSGSAPAAQETQANSSGMEMRVGTLSLKSFAVATDGVGFDSAIADNIHVGAIGSNDASGLKFAHLDISDVFLPALTSFSADASRPISSQVAFLRLLTKATLKTVSIDNAQLGADIAVERIALSDIANAKIVKADLTGTHMDLQPAAGEAGEQTFSAASIALDNIDIDPYLRLFEKSAYLEAGSSKPWKNLVGAISVNGARLKSSSAVVELDNAGLSAFKVRQFNEELTDLFDRAAIDPGFISRDRGAALRIANAVRDSFAFDKISVNKLNIVVPTQEGETKIALSNGALSNLTAAHVDGIDLENLSLNDNGGGITFGKLDLRDINLPAPVESADGATPTVPTVGKVIASNFAAKLGTTQFTVDNLDLAMAYFIGAVPTNVRASVDHVKFTVDQITAPGLRDTLKGLAYNDVDLSFKVSGAWQDSSSAVAVDNISIQGVGMGTLQLSGSLKGITRASFQDPQNILPQEVAAGGIQNLRLSFSNDTLFERFIKEAARQNNKSEDELKRILSTNMSAIMSQIEQPAVRNKFILAAVSFINNPKVLDVATTTSDVTPIQSIGAALGQPYKLPGLLKLDASANGRK